MGATLALDGPVAVLTLAHGKANALDLELCGELTARLRHVAAGPSRALLLSAEGPIFSAGVDLKRLLAEEPDYTARFLPALVEAFTRLFFLPLPVVAAVNGHAIAGGCVLAAAADFRLMARGAGRIGAPELRVGVPFPAIAAEILRAAVPPRHLAGALLAGSTWDAGEALARELIDELVDPAELAARARSLAAGLAGLPPEAYAHTKAQLRAPVRERLAAAAAAGEEDRVVELWMRPATREAIRAWVGRTIGR